MSTTITLDPNNDHPQSINQLGTYNYTTTSAGPYTVSVQAQARAQTGLTITIAQNGTTLATSPAPATPVITNTITGAGTSPYTAPVGAGASGGQTVINLQKLITCALGDNLTVTLSSSVAHDSAINDFQALLNIRPGQV